MSRRGDDGFILVAVLWMIAALAALASAYAVYAVQTAPSAALSEERLRAEAALRAGVELCAFRQLAWPTSKQPDGGAFSTIVGANRVDVIYRSENARVDLNKAPHDLLAGLFQQIGASSSVAGFIADRVVAWRAKPQGDDSRTEAAFYAKAGLAYGPVGAPFDNPLEISLLPGVTPALAERALPFLTVFGKGGRIDPLVADRIVLAALPGATPDAIKSLLAAQRGPPPDATTLTNLAGPVSDFVNAEPSDHLRLEITATLKNRRVRADVIIKINDKPPSPYEILSWRDDFDGDRPGD